MPAVQVGLTAAGYSGPVAINLAKFRGGVGIVVNIPSGTTAVYDVQLTGDERPSGLSNWNLHDILQSQSASANSNLVFPVTALRLHVQTIVGPGPVTMSVIQVDG